MDKISFCITYYNQQEYVEQSINSILAIDIPCNFEILIGDDGSTDNTIEKVQELQKQYPDKIKYFVMSRDNNVKYDLIQRVAANRLNLVENATGNYLMFLDGDDFYCDKTFIVDALNQFKNDSKLVACAFNYKEYYPDDNLEKIPKQKCKEGMLDKNKYIRNGWYTPSGAIVFKNILDQKKLLNLKNSKNFDDNVITIYMFQFGKVYYINKPIYSYRQTTNSVWNSKVEIEQSLLNAMDYEIMSKIAKKFKNIIAKRQYPSIKKIYKNRKTLKVLLGSDNYQKYVDENKKLGNKFICNLLNWNKLTILDKFFIKLEILEIKYCL